MSSYAGFKFIEWLNTMAGSSADWSATDYWNEVAQDTGKINLHHDATGWDFYVMRAFASDDDELVYAQPLSTIYSSYAISGVTPAALISGEEVACSFISRPWLEHGIVQGRGDAAIYAIEGASSISWCAQVGVSNVKGFGVSAWGSLGLVGAYRYAGGLPYNATDERPYRIYDHFFTPEGSIVATTGIAGVTSAFTAITLEDMLLANPFIEDSDLTFQAYQIFIKDASTWPGFILDLYWIASHRVTLEATDGLTLYIPNETASKVFQDGSREDRYVAMVSPVQI